MRKMPTSPFVDEEGGLQPEWRHYLRDLQIALGSVVSGEQSTAAELAAEAIAMFLQAQTNDVALEEGTEDFTKARFMVGSNIVMTHTDDDVTFTHGFTDFTRDNCWHRFYESLGGSGGTLNFHNISPIVDAVSYHGGAQVDSIDAVGLPSPQLPFIYSARYINEVDRL